VAEGVTHPNNRDTPHLCRCRLSDILTIVKQLCGDHAVDRKAEKTRTGHMPPQAIINLPLRLLGMIWASPYTLLGLILGTLGLCTGGRARIRGRVIEFHGGSVKWLLQRFFFGEGAMAFVLGHTVLGQTAAALDISRDHELIHVRQFERWGLLMGPAYLGCSLILWFMGRRPYHDNPFEREAFEQGGGG